MTEKIRLRSQARETLKHVMDSIALLGHANWKLNIKRREVIKPDLNPPFTRLCKEEIKPKTKLFGDDLSPTPSPRQTT